MIKALPYSYISYIAIDFPTQNDLHIPRSQVRNVSLPGLSIMRPWMEPIEVTFVKGRAVNDHQE